MGKRLDLIVAAIDLKYDAYFKPQYLISTFSNLDPSDQMPNHS